MSMPTLLDIAKLNGNDAVVGLVDEASRAHPEISRVPSRTVRGKGYSFPVLTALGNSSGSFRLANAGSTPHKGVYEQRSIECSIIEPRWECDKAVADSYEDGWEAFVAKEGAATLEGEMQGLASQFYYGTTAGSSSGFKGLIDQYDSTNMVVDAAGTTGSTGSSVWLVKFGPQGVQWVWGNNGQLELSPVRIADVVDPAASTKRFTAYVQTMVARPAVALHSRLAAVRIKKLTADSGKTLTDALLIQAMLKFPAGVTPDVIFMNRRSLGQLQASRTATSPVGSPPPLPTDFFGIPIAVTDAILSTESLTL